MNKKIRILGSSVNVEKIQNFDHPKIMADENKQNFIYLKSRIMTCNEPNTNGDYFPADEVKASYETFIGGIVDFNHDQNMILGKIIDAVYIDGGKELDSVEIICKINKKAYTDVVEQIEAGILHQMSLEAYADEAECSICGHNFDFVERQPCDHINGGLMRKIMCEDGEERQVYKIDKKLTMTGAGVVPNPADKTADIGTVIAKAQGKVKEGKIEEAKGIVEEEMKDDTLNSALTKLNALEFISVLDAIKNKSNGSTEIIANEIANSTEDILTDKEFYDILSTRYSKLTTIEIDDIKDILKAKNKLLNTKYNAHVVKGNKETYWLITENSIPKFKASINKIWDKEDLEKDVEIDNMPLNEYAVSSTFKKRLLYAIQKEGIDYIKDVWGIEENEQEESNILLEVKALAHQLGYEIEASEIVSELMKGLDIKASQTLYIKDKFCECVEQNIENEDIELKAGQERKDAAEAYCYNKLVAGGKIFASKKEYNVYDILWRVFGGKYTKCSEMADKKTCSWLDYKVSGKWYKGTEGAKKLLAKQFVQANKDKDLDRFNDMKDYMVNVGFDREFVGKYGVFASKKDIDSLLNSGFNNKDIVELFKLRFMG